MKKWLTVVLAITVFACASQPVSDQQTQSQQNTQACLGSTDLPASLQAAFEPVEDFALLQQTLGKPEQGKLCQARVYQSKQATQVNVHRVWDSVNPNSRLGKWWAFEMPQGKIADYRAKYQICYQWSPLDMLVSCMLKPGTKIVVGTGQSEKCSQYVNYPVSAAQQVYIADAADVVENCNVLTGRFDWQ